MTPRVMIVEDEEPLSLMLRYNLEAEGYQVDSVDRGDEAETRLRETVPDLLLLAWMLPGVSGIELCRRLRSRALTRSSSMSPATSMSATWAGLDRRSRARTRASSSGTENGLTT